MTTKQKSQQCRKAISTQRKRITVWRSLGVPWKAILRELKLDCDHRTLATNYHARGLV